MLNKRSLIPIAVALLLAVTAAVLISGSSKVITDGAGNGWGVPSQNGQVFLNGSSGVAQIVYASGAVWEENASAQWYALNSSGAVASGPTTTSPLTGTTPPPGGFHVNNSKIIDPNGKNWIGMGVDIHDFNLAASVSTIVNDFPGINLVRVAAPSGYGEAWPAPSSFAAAVTSLTNAGIVVEFTDYSNSIGTGGGGAQGAIFTGSLLAAESAWYASMATYYKNNPYVWLGTNNEPALVYPDGKSYATGPNSLAAWQAATYAAIRNTGNTNPIFLEPSGSRPPGYGGTPLVSYTDVSYIAKMTGVIWDPHVYSYQDGNSTNAATNNKLVVDTIAAVQSVKSADGVMPAIIGEVQPLEYRRSADCHRCAACRDQRRHRFRGLGHELTRDTRGAVRRSDRY